VFSREFTTQKARKHESEAKQLTRRVLSGNLRRSESGKSQPVRQVSECLISMCCCCSGGKLPDPRAEITNKRDWLFVFACEPAKPSSKRYREATDDVPERVV
jgi:hypothetical protein